MMILEVPTTVKRHREDVERRMLSDVDAGPPFASITPAPARSENPGCEAERRRAMPGRSGLALTLPPCCLLGIIDIGTLQYWDIIVKFIIQQHSNTVP